MRRFLVLIPVLLGAAVLAQDAPTPEELVAKLGHKDYEVREKATQDLIRMGEKAVPALEKALESDDIEVRLRAGRALRAIRGRRDAPPSEARERVEEGGGAPEATATQIEIRNGKVRVTIREKRGGRETVRTYEGKSLQELREKYPELREKLGGFKFEYHRSRDPFDLDKFWEDWDRDFDRFNDDFMKRWREDIERWRESMRKWDLERRRSWRKLLEPRTVPEAHVLGVRASRPPEVVDAQLDLRGVGLVIDAVEEETLAARLGLKRYDILLKLDGHEIRAATDVRKILADHERERPGEPVTATVLRRGSPVELKAPLEPEAKPGK